MFRIGLPEIIIIVLVIVIFVNPKEFPGFLRKLGAFFKQIKDMRETFTRSMSEVEAEIRMSTSPGAPAAQVREGGAVNTAGADSLAIQTTAGSVPVRRAIVRDTAPTAPVTLHVFVHTGMGDCVNCQGVLRHAIESAGADERIVAVSYEIGDVYSVKDYTPRPHEIWTISRPAEPEELERILASAVKGLACTCYPHAGSITVIDYRQQTGHMNNDPSISYRELYAYYTDTLAPLGVFPEFPIDQAVLRSMRDRLKERIGGLGKRPVVALHLRRRSDNPQKNPRRAQMLELARRLGALRFARVLFAEPEFPDPELEALGEFTCPLDPSFQEPASLLSLCNVFVGGDSGPAHLAAAVGTPVVSLRPPSERWVNGPFCPIDRLAPVLGTVVEEGGLRELAFDVDTVVAKVLGLVVRQNSA